MNRKKEKGGSRVEKHTMGPIIFSSPLGEDFKQKTGTRQVCPSSFDYLFCNFVIEMPYYLTISLPVKIFIFIINILNKSFDF